MPVGRLCTQPSDIIPVLVGLEVCQARADPAKQAPKSLWYRRCMLSSEASDLLGHSVGSKRAEESPSLLSLSLSSPPRCCICCHSFSPCELHGPGNQGSRFIPVSVGTSIMHFVSFVSNIPKYGGAFLGERFMVDIKHQA